MINNLYRVDTGYTEMFPRIIYDLYLRDCYHHATLRHWSDQLLEIFRRHRFILITFLVLLERNARFLKIYSDSYEA